MTTISIPAATKLKTHWKARFMMPTVRSEKLGNAVTECADPNAIHCDCQPNSGQWPSRPKRFTCSCNHDVAPSFSRGDLAGDDAAGM